MKTNAITEETRNKIALSITKLTTDQAENIANACQVSTDTVYRALRIMRGAEKGNANEEVVISLGELAIELRKTEKQRRKRIERIRKQFSETSAN
jgi:uncharacterized protein YggU (UPF0235/DUF167 family)